MTKKSKYPREFVKALAENGISLLGVPEEHGGIPADYVTQMLAIMEIAKCGAPAFLMTNGQCMHSMIHFGSPEQLRLDGRKHGHHGRPRLLARSDGAGRRFATATPPTTTFARPQRRQDRDLNGQKTFITGAAEYPVHARSSPAIPKQRGSEESLLPLLGRREEARHQGESRFTRSAGTS